MPRFRRCCVARSCLPCAGAESRCSHPVEQPAILIWHPRRTNPRPCPGRQPHGIHEPRSSQRARLGRTRVAAGRCSTARLPRKPNSVARVSKRKSTVLRMETLPGQCQLCLGVFAAGQQSGVVRQRARTWRACRGRNRRKNPGRLGVDLRAEPDQLPDHREVGAATRPTERSDSPLVPRVDGPRRPRRAPVGSPTGVEPAERPTSSGLSPPPQFSARTEPPNVP